MPELPEVETTRRGINRHVCGKRVIQLVLRNPNLRCRVPQEMVGELAGQVIKGITRRGKYLLLGTEDGTVIIHLGMSGSLRIVSTLSLPGKHDHVDIALENGQSLRYRDPRRFGLILWTQGDPHQHPLLQKLGLEPLGPDFNGDYLYRRSQGRRCAIKKFIMDAHIVVGVGNIYANEALFRAGIHPLRSAARISLRRYQLLVTAIRKTLKEAIAQGGTTLRDFYDSEGQPGYFQQSLRVYGRHNLACVSCGLPIIKIVQGQRSSFYCNKCQR